jgi:TPR repeat protein
MRRQTVSCVACLVVTAASMKAGWIGPAQAFAHLLRPDILASPASFTRIASGGIDIVRIPPEPLPWPERKTQPGPERIQPAQAQGRLVKLAASIGSVPAEAGKAWLGVSTDYLDLPLALSLGRTRAEGALVMEAAIASPAGQAGLRLGDIVVSFNDKPVRNMEELRRYVESTAPGDRFVLEAWRATRENEDFVQRLRRLGEGGNTHAMYRLGRMYWNGLGLARNDAEAAIWYRKAADAGNVQAMAALAGAALEGRGTDKNPQEAVRLYRAAAAKDHVEATYRLGVLTVQGRGVDKDALEGMRLLTKAADAGHAPAMLDLGVMHNHGIGINVDFIKAAAWYKRAADHGNASAMTGLGFLHELGKGVDQSDSAAAALYRKAADLGNAQGMHNLGAMYDRGRGVEHRDPEQAADLILRALESRNQFTYDHMTKHSQQWSAEFRRALQRKLRDAGYFDGQINGYFRSTTIAAINAYISRENRTGERKVSSGIGGRWL